MSDLSGLRRGEIGLRSRIVVQSLVVVEIDRPLALVVMILATGRSTWLVLDLFLGLVIYVREHVISLPGDSPTNGQASGLVSGITYFHVR